MSLCNVSMKIIMKALANIFSQILPYIISDLQSALVKDRIITDNVILAHEIIHHIRMKKYSGKGFLSIKVDMSKAYDRVEWDFLRVLIFKLGFAESWVNKVMKYVESVKHSVKVNGLQSEFFQPSRGLRQGDPISPYLFILCQEWMSINLDYMQSKNQIVGVKLARELPRINHLFFSDDCLLFIKAKVRLLENLKNLLVRYEEGVGQKINVRKSEFTVSCNVDEVLCTLFSNFLEMVKVPRHTKYLDLSLVVGQNKGEVFKILEDKMEEKVTN